MAAMPKQEWHHKGSSCCSPIGSCCLSWWCPCILYGRTRHRMKANGDMSDYSCCNMSCAAFTGLTCVGFAWILPLINRGDVRAKYNLTGNGCKDCICACCCGPCDLMQQDKEVQHREEQGKPLLDQPGKADTMNYAPQWQQQETHYHDHR